MRFDPQAGHVWNRPKSWDTRRRFGRLPQETLMSNIGLVLDLSAGGMRVLCRRTPPERIRISLRGHNLPGPLNGVITWSRRVGLFRHEVGVRFEDISSETKQALADISAVHRLRRVL